MKDFGPRMSTYRLKPQEERWAHANSYPETQECFPGLFAYAGCGSGDLWIGPASRSAMTSDQARQVCKDKGWDFKWFDSFNYVLEMSK